jgi:hypothetical protein
LVREDLGNCTHKGHTTCKSRKIHSAEIRQRSNSAMHTKTRGNPTLTSLWGRREESYLDLLFTELIRQFSDTPPGGFAHCVFKLVEIIEEMNFAAGVDCNLITSSDAETGVVARTKVHDALASGGISLLIYCARDRELRIHTGPQLRTFLMRSIDINGGRLGAGGDV